MAVSLRYWDPMMRGRPIWTNPLARREPLAEELISGIVGEVESDRRTLDGTLAAMM